MAIYAATVAALFISLLAVAGVVVWTRQDFPFVRAGAIVASLVVAAVFSAAFLVPVGHPVPVIQGFNAPKTGKVDVIAYSLKQGEAIFLLVAFPDEPRLYRLPWSEQAAEKLQQLANDRRNAGIRWDSGGQAGGAAGQRSGDGESDQFSGRPSRPPDQEKHDEPGGAVELNN